LPYPGKKTTNRDKAGETTWRQGYYPEQPDISHQHIAKNDPDSVRRRPPGRRESRFWLVMLISGIALLLVAAGLLIPVILARVNRQKTESALQTIYYQTAAPVMTEVPSPSVIPTAAAFASALPQATASPLRSFATRAPWKVNVTRDRFLSLRRINKDVAGWLTINGVLDLPVVQRDNTYYLTRDFYGKTNYSGTLFLDENYDVGPPSENLLIHGHNMRDGSMFGRLYRYNEKAFYADHWLVRFETLYEQSDYAVFAAFTTSSDSADPSYFRYAYNRFATDSEFTAFIAAVRKRSVIRSGLEVLPTDRLIMLSTCMDGDQYFVVMGRRIRDDETIPGVELICVLSAYQ